MEEIDQLRHYLRLDNLRAMLVLSEIERVGLNFEIDSSQTTPERKAEATARRDAVMIEWARRITELQELENFLGVSPD